MTRWRPGPGRVGERARRGADGPERLGANRWGGGPAGASGAADTVGLAVAGAAVATGAWAWAAGELAGRLASGRWPRVAASQIPSVVLRLPGHLADPRRAWPAAAQGSLPGAALCYASALALLVMTVAVASCAWAGRRRWQGVGLLGGTGGRGRPGSRWATRRDLRPLAVRPHGSGRLVLGVAGRVTVAAEARHSVLVVGPTQSGKTSGLAVPAILEWPGPVVATSVKDDLAATTLAWRSGHGRCWVFDPTGSSGIGHLARWSPLAACTDWGGAQRVATWLVEGTPSRSGVTDAAFWYAAAAKQLAPLLLAASRGGMPVSEVVRWTNLGSFDEPATLLEAAGEADAAVALYACEARDERIRSSVGTTLETVLGPFEDPVVGASTSASDIELGALLGGAHTLYLCGPSHEQQRVQGLFATLVSAVIAAAVGEVARRGGPLDPPLLVVLDEVANIAPVRDLDGLASTGAGLGVQLVTVCQDLAQLAARYGAERARTIANNHRAKLVLSGVADLGTLDLLSGLAGEHAVREETFTHDLRDGRRTRSSASVLRRLAPADELRRIPPGQGVLVYGHLPPARLRLRPWYQDRFLRRRAGSPGGGAGGRRSNGLPAPTLP